MEDRAAPTDALRLLQRCAAALSIREPIAGLPAVAAALAELPGVRRAAVLALPEDRSATLYVLAASDERMVLRLPFPAAGFPDIRAAIEARRAGRGRFREPCPLGVEPGSGPLEVVPIVAEGEALGCLTLRLEATAAAAPDPAAATRAAALPAEVLASVAQLVALGLRGGRVLESLREQTRKVTLEPSPGVRRQAAIEGYRDYFDSAADGILVVGAHAEVLHINRAAEQLTGYSRAGVRGRSLFDFVPADQHQGLGAIVERSAGGQQLAAFDFDIVTTSGERMRVSASTSAVLAEHGAAVFAFRDVTEARALEDELRKTKDFLLRLIDAAVDGIIATDMDGNVILFNQGAAKVFGWSADEVIGRLPVDALYPEGVARQVMAELRDPRSGGKLSASRREVLLRSGERIPIELAASIVYEAGHEVATVGIFTDLRDRLRIERSLAEAQERLLVSEKQAMIAELAGTTAHELNQPLTSVMGYAELLLKRSPEGAPDRRAVEIVLREAERMAEIVRKIGRITRYESKPYVGSASILDLEKSAGEPQ